MDTAAPSRAPSARITVSVVSHGHDDWLQRLLPALAATGAGIVAHVVLTHNVPAARPIVAQADWPFRLTQIRNLQPAGFGTNHNHAFKRATHDTDGGVDDDQRRGPDSGLFCVLNPDISLPDPGVWQALAALAATPGVGCAFPSLLNPDGSPADNGRAVPTPWALLRRRLLGREDLRLDWASAAFWVLPNKVYEALGGFDERYFLYCEDTDLCLRLQLNGWRLARSPARAVHHAQRDSRRPGQHLLWHLRSMIRLWLSRAMWTYLWRRARGSRPPPPG